MINASDIVFFHRDARDLAVRQLPGGEAVSDANVTAELNRWASVGHAHAMMVLTTTLSAEAADEVLAERLGQMAVAHLAYAGLVEAQGAMQRDDTGKSAAQHHRDEAERWLEALRSNRLKAAAAQAAAQAADSRRGLVGTRAHMIRPWMQGDG